MKPQEIAAAARQRALTMIRDGFARREVLTHIASVAERLSVPGCAASILVLDENGLLRNGASPNIPADYLDAIDRLKPDANVGTCAAAAATGNVVITRSFTDDSKWSELRHLPLSLGYVGEWSTPIKGDNGRVLGTLGIYNREQREPTLEEKEVMSLLASAAAQAISSTHAPA